jgi:hypothetical protein
VGISLQWVRHLRDQDSKDKLEQAIRGSVTALSRLLDLLEEQEQALNNQEASTSDFEDPNWSHKQAFRNGQKNQLKEIKKLLAFTKE